MSPPPVHPEALRLKQQGDGHFSERNFAAAVSRYTEALGVAEDAVVLSNRSAAFAQRRCFREALEDAERALGLQPAWPRLQHRRGHALFHLGRYGEAIEAFARGLALDPEDEALREAAALAEAHTEPASPRGPPSSADAGPRGAPKSGAVPTPPAAAPPSPRASDPAGRFEVVFERVVVRGRPSTQAAIEALHTRGAVVEGVPCDVAGQPWLRLEGGGWMLMDGASLGLGPLLAPAQQPSGAGADRARERGNDLFRERKYSAAIRAYSESIDKNAKDARTWANRAAAQIKMLEEFGRGMPPAALQDNSYFLSAKSDLEESLRIDPQYVKALARLGQLHLMGGDKPAARRSFDRGLEIEPAHAECLAGRAACR